MNDSFIHVVPTYDQHRWIVIGLRAETAEIFQTERDGLAEATHQAREASDRSGGAVGVRNRDATGVWHEHAGMRLPDRGVYRPAFRPPSAFPGNLAPG